MGVDFYACDCCGESLYDEYVGHCNQCDSSLCTACLVNDDVNDRFAYKYGYRYDSNNPELMQKYIDEGFGPLVNEEGEPYFIDGAIIDDSGIDSKYCPYCSGESINEEILFKYIVEKYKLDVKEEWKQCKGK